MGVIAGTSSSHDSGFRRPSRPSERPSTASSPARPPVSADAAERATTRAEPPTDVPSRPSSLDDAPTPLAQATSGPSTVERLAAEPVTSSYPWAPGGVAYAGAGSVAQPTSDYPWAPGGVAHAGAGGVAQPSSSYPWSPGGVVYAGTGSVAEPDTPDPATERRDAEVREQAIATATQGPNAGVDAFIDFAAGGSELGALDEREQGIAIDAALDTWLPPEAGPHDMTFPALPEILTWRLGDRGEEALLDVATARYVERTDAALARAAALGEDTPEGRRARGEAANLAASALFGLARDPAGTAALIAALDDPVRFVDALALDLPDSTLGGEWHTLRHEMRTAAAAQAVINLADAPMNDRQTRFVATVFTSLPAEVHTYHGGEQREALGLAFGRALTADIADPIRRETEAVRLGGILATDQGAELLGLSENIPTGQRLDALALVRANPTWNAATFAASESVWNNPTVMEAFARPRAEAFLDYRGDAPVALGGTDLENQVGFALGLPPDVYPDGESAATIAAREARAADGEHSYYARHEAAELIAPVIEEIRAVGGDAPEVTIVPVQFSSSAGGVQELALFRVVDPADPEAETFVDATGARFDGIDDWRRSNELPPGFYVIPSGGHLQGTPGVPAAYDPPVHLESDVTHATVDTWQEHALQWADTAATGAALVAGGAILLGSGGTAAPFVFGAGVLWQAGRAGERLLDRHAHHRPLGLDDPGARRDWLDLGTSLFAAVGAGYVVQASRLSRAGAPLARLGAIADDAATLNRAGAVLDTATALNDGHDLISNWDELDAGERASLALSIGFWTTGAAAQRRLGQSADRAAGDPGGALYDPASLRYRWLDAHDETAWRSAGPGTSDYRWSDTVPPIRAGHLFEGHRNGAGNATGWHHRPDGVDPEWRRATPTPARIDGVPVLDASGNPVVRDDNGVYHASVEIWDPVSQSWKPKGGTQTFFPDRLSEANITGAIITAHDDALAGAAGPVLPNAPVALPDGQYTGDSGLGFDVRYRLRTIDGEQRIVSAYPVFTDPSAAP